jgi:cellulose synthase (UDP-forming)
LILLLVPSLEIYFDLRPMTVSISVFSWFMYYGGFYVMQVLLAWYTLGSFRWETLTLSVVSFPIYVKALFNVLTGRDVGWQATGTARGGSPFNFVVPQMLFFLFLSLTSVVAIYRDVSNGVATLATAWNVTNTVILGAFLIAVARDARLLRRGTTGSAPTGSEPTPEPRTVVARPTGIREPQRPPVLVPATSSPLPRRLKESVR